MNARIPPWLGHLRRDRRGLPVPYINLWGTETADRYAIRYDPHVGRPAVYFDDATATAPDFTKQNFQRQRECMVRGLCQVCARPVPWRRRRLVIAEMSVETIDLDGAVVPVVTEPWLDARCATFAVEHCPDLIRRTRHEELTVVEVTGPEQVTMATSVGLLDGPLRQRSLQNPPAMWVKLYLREHALDTLTGGPR